MARTVVWAESASTDLLEILEYIARDSPFYARAFALEVQEAARSLALFAERGRVVPELGVPTVREVFVRRYRLVYRVREGCVDVVAVIHGARDFPSAWRDRG